jgi:hypothetical protein
VVKAVKARHAEPGDANGDAANGSAVHRIAASAQAVSLTLAAPEVKQATVAPLKRSETFLAGTPGEELPDYTIRFNSDGSVRETAVCFYEGDQRAASARKGDPLRREAVYLGPVDSLRLHAVRKLSDTNYVGQAGHERRDRRVEYHPDGHPGQTVIFYYDGDARAADVPSGAKLRRQVVFEGDYRG